MYPIRAFLEVRPRPLSMAAGKKKGAAGEMRVGQDKRGWKRCGLVSANRFGWGWGGIVQAEGPRWSPEANCGRTEMPGMESAVLNDQPTVKVKGARRPKMT